MLKQRIIKSPKNKIPRGTLRHMQEPATSFTRKIQAVSVANVIANQFSACAPLPLVVASVCKQAAIGCLDVLKNYNYYNESSKLDYGLALRIQNYWFAAFIVCKNTVTLIFQYGD